MDLIAANGHNRHESLEPLEGSREEDGMKLIGYARVEVGEDGLEQQESRLRDAGCGKVFSENHVGVGRKAAKRSQGHALCSIEEGDVFMADKLSRIGRDDLDAFKLCAALRERGAHVVLLDDGVDTRKDTDTFFETIAQRLVAEGISEKDVVNTIEEAEAVGKKTRRFKIRPEDLPTIAKMVTQGKSTPQIAAAYDVNETAVRRAYKRLGWKVDNRKRERLLSPEAHAHTVG